MDTMPHHVYNATDRMMSFFFEHTRQMLAADSCRACRLTCACANSGPPQWRGLWLQAYTSCLTRTNAHTIHIKSNVNTDAVAVKLPGKGV